MNDSPIMSTSLPAIPLGSQLEGPPVVLPPDELLVSFVTLSVLEAPPPLVPLVVDPIELELLPVVLAPNPLLLTPLVLALVADAVVIPSPPVVVPLEVVELTVPELVLATVELDAVLTVVVTVLVVVLGVPVEPMDSFKGSLSSAGSLLQAATRPQSANAAPQRNRRIVLESWAFRRTGAALPRQRRA